MLKNFQQDITEYLKTEIETIQRVNIEELNEAMNAIFAAWEREATIYICGNGGSASTASHFVCDFNKGVSETSDKKFRFVSLNDNIAMLTALANDISYGAVFSCQLEGRMRASDLLIAISGSGNSKNIINAVEYAKTVGTKVIGISGYDGGQLKLMADYSMNVPINNMQIVEDIHIIFNHMMMRIFSDIK